MIIWILIGLLLVVLIVNIGKGNTKKNLEIEKLKAETEKHKFSDDHSKVNSIAEELTKLKDLKDKGILTDAEFDEQKTKILNR